MSGLGLGLVAADQYFKEGDARKVRDRQEQRFDWERQKEQAGLDILPDVTAERRAGSRFRAAQSAAGLEALPAEEALRSTERQVRAGDAAGALTRQPTEQETRNVNAEGALSDARNKVATQPVRQRIENTKLGMEDAITTAGADTLPDQIEGLAVKGVLTQADQIDAVNATLGRRLQANDKPGALQFINAIATRSSVLPNTNGVTFTDIELVNDGQDSAGNTGPGYVFKSADGRGVFVTHKTMQTAVARAAGSPKFKFLQDTTTGQIAVGNERTGGVEVAVPGDPTRPRRGAHTGPLERDVTYLTSTFGMSENQALSHLNQAKTMSRPQFILKSIEGMSALGKQPSDADIVNFGKLYDSAAGSSPAQRPAASNSPAAPKIDPRFNSILGIPPN